MPASVQTLPLLVFFGQGFFQYLAETVLGTERLLALSFQQCAVVFFITRLSWSAFIASFEGEDVDARVAAVLAQVTVGYEAFNLFSDLVIFVQKSPDARRWKPALHAWTHHVVAIVASLHCLQLDDDAVWFLYLYFGCIVQTSTVFYVWVHYAFQTFRTTHGLVIPDDWKNPLRICCLLFGWAFFLFRVVGWIGMSAYFHGLIAEQSRELQASFFLLTGLQLYWAQLLVKKAKRTSF